MFDSAKYIFDVFIGIHIQDFYCVTVVLVFVPNEYLFKIILCNSDFSVLPNTYIFRIFHDVTVIVVIVCHKEQAEGYFNSFADLMVSDNDTKLVEFFMFRSLKT